MGKRGPKPTPKAVLQLRGSWRGKVGPDHPDEHRDGVTVPGILSEEAREHWEYLVERVTGMSVMAREHELALMMLCEALVDYERYRDLSRKTGDRLDDVRRSAAWKEVMAGLQQFGLTPAAISGVKKTDSAQKQPSSGKGNYFATG